jgi:hypothetical protein
VREDRDGDAPDCQLVHRAGFLVVEMQRCRCGDALPVVSIKTCAS